LNFQTILTKSGKTFLNFDSLNVESKIDFFVKTIKIGQFKNPDLQMVSREFKDSFIALFPEECSSKVE
jgi:hypothetical protein